MGRDKGPLFELDHPSPEGATRMGRVNIQCMPCMGSAMEAKRSGRWAIEGQRVRVGMNPGAVLVIRAA